MSKRDQYPLILRWHEAPVRAIQAPKRKSWLNWFLGRSATQGDQPFDFCASMERLVADIAIRCSDFRHLQPSRIFVTVTQARGKSTHGLQARVTPLRFAGGSLTRMQRGVPYQIQRFFLREHEYWYLMTFCLPRFLDQDFDQKLTTLFHELYHISPAFDGDLRRHKGRCAFHTHSKRAYDEHMVEFARDYLAGRPDANLHGFLRLNFAEP